MGTTTTATFAVDSFTWSDGTFEVRGRWSEDAAGLGRVRLLVDVDGRRRNIGAQGGKTAGGDEWRARFMCSRPPEAGAEGVLKVADLELDLPALELAEPPPEPAPEAAPDLLELLRAERAAADVARQRLARERRATEEAEARLAATRRRVAPTPPGATEPTPPDVLGYVVAGLIAVLFVALLLLVL